MRSTIRLLEAAAARASAGSGSFVDASTQSVNTDAESISAPALTQVGDVMIYAAVWWMYIPGMSTPAPAGWTSLYTFTNPNDTKFRFQVFGKAATSGDLGASWSLATTGQPCYLQGGVFTYRGVTLTGVQVSGGATAFGTSTSTPSVTGTKGGILLSGFGFGSDPLVAPAIGAPVTSRAPAYLSPIGSAFGDEPLTVDGPTAARTATVTQNSSPMRFALALDPA